MDAQQPIDAVVTWVDGDDPGHAAKRARYLGAAAPTGAATTRFASRDEIRYCLLSLLKHAAFLRRIFVVTDSQTPTALAEITAQDVPGHDKITLVDHHTIFRGHEDLLPVFNSISIESMLFRIPGLTERFVMFNDDIFLTAPVQPEDWFNGPEVVMRGQWFGPGLTALGQFRRLAAHLPGLSHAARQFSNKEAHRLGALAAGLTARTFVAGHTPHPALRSHYEQIFANMPQTWLANTAHRFRNSAQFNVISLFNHWEITRHHPVLKDEADLVYLRADRDSLERIRQKLARVDADCSKFLCVQSLDQATPEAAALLTGWLDARFAYAPTL
jgi:hypothetical protein